MNFKKTNIDLLTVFSILLILNVFLFKDVYGTRPEDPKCSITVNCATAQATCKCVAGPCKCSKTTAGCKCTCPATEGDSEGDCGGSM